MLIWVSDRMLGYIQVPERLPHWDKAPLYFFWLVTWAAEKRGRVPLLTQEQRECVGNNFHANYVRAACPTQRREVDLKLPLLACSYMVNWCISCRVSVEGKPENHALARYCILLLIFILDSFIR